MTRGPRRLKQDTDFKWETGCDLSDEEAVVGGYDHDRMRSRLLAAVALVPGAELSVGDGVPSVRAAGSSSGATGTGSAGWGWSAVQAVVAGLAGVAVVSGAYWLGTQAGSEAVPEAVPIVAPVAPDAVAPLGTDDPGPGFPLRTGRSGPVDDAAEREVPAPALSTTAVGGSGEAGPPVAPPVPALRTSSAKVAAAASPLVSEVDAVPATSRSGTPDDGGADTTFPTSPAGGPATDADAAPAKPPISRFAEEGVAFGQARDALDAGRFDDARRLFGAYLERFPDGSMRPEAHLGRLEAARGRWSATRSRADLEILAAVSAELQDLPTLASRRDEIVRLRAESLVELGRCDEATSVSEAHTASHGGRLAAEIRRACRASRRE